MDRVLDAGATTKENFRYQDCCAMYFALDSFARDAKSFERVYCEQGKLDFEIWKSNNFIGFQVKSNPSVLSAKEVNAILIKYLDKSIKSGKDNNLFLFLFTKHPAKSLNHFFDYARKDNRGVTYSPRIQNYIDQTLAGIDLNILNVDYGCYNLQEIERLVFSAAAEILKKGLRRNEDILTEIIVDFVARLRDELDKISMQKSAKNRFYTQDNLNDFILKFLSRIRITKLEAEGEQVVKIQAPKYLGDNEPKSVKIQTASEAINFNKSEADNKVTDHE